MNPLRMCLLKVSLEMLRWFCLTQLAYFLVLQLVFSPTKMLMSVDWVSSPSSESSWPKWGLAISAECYSRCSKIRRARNARRCWASRWLSGKLSRCALNNHPTAFLFWMPFRTTHNALDAQWCTCFSRMSCVGLVPRRPPVCFPPCKARAVFSFSLLLETASRSLVSATRMMRYPFASFLICTYQSMIRFHWCHVGYHGTFCSALGHSIKSSAKSASQAGKCSLDEC